jgi:hypothetical protein
MSMLYEDNNTYVRCRIIQYRVRASVHYGSMYIFVRNLHHTVSVGWGVIPYLCHTVSVGWGAWLMAHEPICTNVT